MITLNFTLDCSNCAIHASGYVSLLGWVIEIEFGTSKCSDVRPISEIIKLQMSKKAAAATGHCRLGRSNSNVTRCSAE